MSESALDVWVWQNPQAHALAVMGVFYLLLTQTELGMGVMDTLNRKLTALALACRPKGRWTKDPYFYARVNKPKLKATERPIRVLEGNTAPMLVKA